MNRRKLGEKIGKGEMVRYVFGMMLLHPSLSRLLGDSTVSLLLAPQQNLINKNSL